MSTISWKDAVDSITQRFASANGWEEERARQAAEIAVDAMRREYGGARHYLPARNGEIKKRIIDEFNGRNITELCRVHGVSARTVRRYVLGKE